MRTTWIQPRTDSGGCAGGYTLAYLISMVILSTMLSSWRFDVGAAEISRDKTQWPPTKESVMADTPPDIRALIEKTFSPNEQEQLDAVIALRKAGRRAIPAVPFLMRVALDSEGNPAAARVRDEASRVIDREDLGAAAVEPLLAALDTKQYKGETRRSIVGKLGWIEDRRAIPALIAALEDDDPMVRYYAADGLGSMPDQRAFEPLMRCLHDKNQDVVSSATIALGAIGDRRAVEPILDLLKDKGRETSVRYCAACALGKIGDPRAFDALLAVCKERKDRPTGSLRECALRALGRTKDPRAFVVLQRELKSKDVRERQAAVWGLAGLGDTRSIKVLESILKEERPTQLWYKAELPTPRIRPQAALALVSTGDDAAIDAVYEEYKVSPPIIDAEIKRGVEDSIKDLHFRTAVVDALAMSPKPHAYLKIIDVLGGTDACMREEAARVLHCSMKSGLLVETDYPESQRAKLPALDDPRILHALMKVAGNEGESKGAREDAIAALRKSGNPEALKFVEKFGEEGKDK